MSNEQKVTSNKQKKRATSKKFHHTTKVLLIKFGKGKIFKLQKNDISEELLNHLQDFLLDKKQKVVLNVQNSL